MEDEKPVGRPYRGPSGIARDSIWLTWEDLLDSKGKPREVEVQIAEVLKFDNVKFEAGRKKDVVLGLQFVGKKRILGLTAATNRKMLNKMFGGLGEDWVGKKIVLYVGEARDPKGGSDKVPCVRIRDRGSNSTKSADAFLAEEKGGGAVAGVGAAPTTGAAPSAVNGGEVDWVVAFDQQCDSMGATTSEREAVVLKHAGDFEAAYREMAGA